MDISSPLTLRILTVVLMLFPSFTVALLPNGQCSVQDMACQLGSDNVVGIINGIASVEDCKLECEDDSNGCKVYSYYGPNGSPFVDSCLLFHHCETLEPADDCYTEEVGCSRYCHAPVEGVLGENLINFVPMVSEAACEAECEVEEECRFFTYYWPNSSANANTCFLLRDVKEPITICQDDSCISGSDNCENDLCGFLNDGMLNQVSTVANETKEIDLLVMGPCSGGITSVLAVAIGGGGSTGNDAGSGSGYIEYVELNVTDPIMQFEAQVGLAKEASRVIDITSGNITVLEASPGGSGGNTNGAPGYSGGGADRVMKNIFLNILF